jgi:hypothetical protein
MSNSIDQSGVRDQSDFREAYERLKKYFLSSWLSLAGHNPFFGFEHDDDTGIFKPFNPVTPFGMGEGEITDAQMLSLKLNRKAIGEILDEPFISLFAASVLIGERVCIGSVPYFVFEFTGDMIGLFCEEILKGRIAPMNPDNLLRFPDPVSRELPDLFWLLPIQEVHAFAVRHWPADLFADLIEPEAQAVPEKEKPPSKAEERTAYKLLLGMAIDAYGYAPDKARNAATGEKAGSIKACLERVGIHTDNGTILTHLKMADALFPEVRPRKS